MSGRWPVMWRAYTVPAGAGFDAAEDGGRDRFAAYETAVTSEAMEAFADRGFLADPASPQYMPERLHQREELAAEMAQLRPERQAEAFRSAYAGLTEYRIPEREAG